MSSVLKPRTHILTVALEDYFQVGAFNRIIQQGQWYRFENRLEKNTQRLLDLLAEHGCQATVFVLGWIADKFPELVRKVADQGHEIASKGYYHRGITGLTPQEFKEDLIRSREAIEKAGGQQVIGYRLADGWFTEQDTWAFDVLAEAGYRYDSSIAPIGKNFKNQALGRGLHQLNTPNGDIWEVPISTGKICGFKVPVAGGNYLRQIPHWLMKRAIAKWVNSHETPLVSYFHVWELDPEQPKITAGTFMTRMRHYRHLDRMEGYVRQLLQQYRFTSVANYLDMKIEPVEVHHREVIPVDDTPLNWEDEPAKGTLQPISIVIPCFNEELILPYLSNTLQRVETALSRTYSINFIMVDDGSSDRTWEGLQQLFATRSNVSLYRHGTNRGVAAAIMTGLNHAQTEIVCSIDCDCTYDPHQLETMIPKLTDGVDLITASPYHPEGAVRNVPEWRLKLSRGASWCYRRILRNKLYTYTSCFRVYRRSKAVNTPLRYSNFLGIAELIGKMDLAGSGVVEHPAILEVRMLGRSKMKTLRTIIGHLKLMSSLLWQRVTTKPEISPQSPKQPRTELIHTEQTNLSRKPEELIK